MSAQRAASVTRDNDQATIDVRLTRLAEDANLRDTFGPHVLQITTSLGFESFSYVVVGLGLHPRQDSASYMWTTLPNAWTLLYQRKRYVEVDPRLTRTWNHTAPYLWDAAQSSTEWQVQQFLRDAAPFGIRSGVVVSFCDSRPARIVVALNSGVSPVSPARCAEIQRRLGDVMLLATSFHDFFMAHLAQPDLTNHSGTVRLSPRERQCLQMAARGLTSADIGTKLGITERTANFHFSNLINKLGVLNRHEAIARAVSTGMISLGSD